MKIQVNNSGSVAKAISLSLGWLLASYLSLASVAIAQSPASNTPPNSGANKAPPQSKEQSNLVDGLLDLIEDPDASKQAAPGKTQELVQPTIPSGKESSNPLLTVRDRMRVAAGLLQQGRSDSQTVDVQSSIVNDLDTLIGQLEQQQKSQQKSSNQSMQRMQQQIQQQKTQQNSSQQPGSERENNRSSTKPKEASGENNAPGNEPGAEPGNETGSDPSDRGDAVDPGLRRNDPTALQQSVWGHLPERVRSQMQSRMVEEFLPSYRQHIEAYYRALMEEEGKK